MFFCLKRHKIIPTSEKYAEVKITTLHYGNKYYRLFYLFTMAFLFSATPSFAQKALDSYNMARGLEAMYDGNFAEIANISWWSFMRIRAMGTHLQHISVRQTLLE